VSQRTAFFHLGNLVSSVRPDKIFHIARGPSDESYNHLAGLDKVSCKNNKHCLCFDRDWKRSAQIK